MKSWGKFTLLLAASALAGGLAVTRGGYVSWFLLGVCFVAALYAGMLYMLALSGLSVERTLSDRTCLSGDDLAVTLTVTSRPLVPLPWLVIKETWLHESTGRKFVYRKLLFPWLKRVVIVRYRITHLRRGGYRFERFEAAAGDLFGFAVKHAAINGQQRIVVYPKAEALHREMRAFRSDEGDRQIAGSPWAASSRAGGVREYEMGDPYHRIHWKATAKLGKLMTKEPERTVGAVRMLLLDAAPDTGWAEADQPLLEKGVALAAGFFEAAALGRESCGFACSSAGTKRIAPSIRQDLALAYEVLASVGGKTALSFPDLVRKESAALPPDASMLCITSTLNAALLRAVAEARSRRRSVHVIYVHARPSLSVQDREGAAQLQALGCSFMEVPHPRSGWPQQGGVADATA